MTGTDRNRLAWGWMLIVVGVIFLGDRLNWGRWWDMGHLWPVLLIAFGLMQIVSCADRRRDIGGGYWLMFLGVLFLLNQNHILRLRQAWPLFIVAAGVLMLFTRARTPRDVPAPPSEPPAATEQGADRG